MLIKLSVCNITSIAAATLLLSSCAGRDARPVAISQPQDATMACAQIQAEIAGNNQLIADLGSETGAKVAQNVIVGAAGVLIPVLWFGMDFKGAASTDQEALQQRNILVDGKHGELLLQIFSENQLGPIFFEFIQRKGDQGFGEGNFKALFESLELDQMRRGVLAKA